MYFCINNSLKMAIVHFCHYIKTEQWNLRSEMMYLIVSLILLSVTLPVYGEDTYPAICITTANLNVRTTGSTKGRVIETLPSGTRVQVQRVTFDGWAEIDYYGGLAYCSAKYLMYWEAVTPTPSTNSGNNNHSSGFLSNIGIGNLWNTIFSIAVICILLAILRKVLITILGLISIAFFRLYHFISFPFYCLNWLQRRLAKPWMQSYKRNTRSDRDNAKLREETEMWKIPFWLILTPLRLVNAFYYNIVVHCSFEMFNYVVEVIAPEGEREGSDNSLLWLILLPWRFVKYVVWHGSLTFIESSIWTAIDTLVPALTAYHGTTCAAAEGICQGPGRVESKNWLSAVWNVGGGNYAGNGIYFAPVRSTAYHYASGSLIVCRVSFGRTLDLGLAPRRIYDLCGKPNALGVTDWGLRNGYVTGEWWRGDTRAGWWEYCMYDWQNRYNDSWRIRPLYVLNINDECIQRIPGGMYHWLFNSLVLKDIFSYYRAKR